MINLYLDNGFLDMRSIYQIPCPFICVVGARGTGKTYGALQMIIQDKIPTIYSRRTQTQHDIIANPDFSPFKSLNRDLGMNILPISGTKLTRTWYDTDYDEEKKKYYPVGDEICVTTSLNALHNLRGFDASDKKLWIYDEFIPEKSEKKMKDEGAAFLNGYETMNRNRELEGGEPLKVLLLSNSNQLDSPIFQAFGIVDRAERMKKRDQEISILKDRGIAIIMPHSHEIVNQKSTTALYRATADKKFKEMALDNDFAYDTPTQIKSMPLKEYKLLVVYMGIAIYRHKSRGDFYVTRHVSGTSNDVYGESEADKIRFRANYAGIWEHYIYQDIFFESYSTEIEFKKLFLDK